jgi:subtilisin family serine protease
MTAPHDLPRRYASYKAQLPSNTGYVVGVVALGLWALAVAVLSQVLTWAIEQLLLASSVTMARWWWGVLTGIAGVLIIPGGALLSLARWARVDIRATARQWAVAGGCLAVLGLARAISPTAENEFTLWLNALLAAALAWAVRRYFPANGQINARQTKGTLVLVALGGTAVVLAPWLVWTTLGGITETIAALAAAAALGWLTAELMTPMWLAAFQHRRSASAAVLLSGLVFGLTLTIIAAGVGGSGVQLYAMLSVPPLGFALAALAHWAGPLRRWPVGLLAAAGFSGPLAFVDPEETSLILNLTDSGLAREAVYWILRAAAVGAVLALLLATVYLGLLIATRSGPITGPSRIAVVAAPLALVLAAGGLYATAGQPGFFGERWFVVMDSQADLSGAAGVTDRSSRTQQVYQRLVQQADQSQAALRKALRDKHLHFTPYYLINGIEVGGGAAVREWLNRQPHVAKVLESPRLRPLPEPPLPMRGGALAPSGTPWNIEMVGAPGVWFDFGVTGSGIVIGSSDSGVDGTHPVLAKSFRGNDGGRDSWFDPWNHTTSPTDRNGHGTHTLASALGRTPNGAVPSSDSRTETIRNANAIGVAPGAQWMGCVNLARDLGSPARYLDCLQFMFAPFQPGADPLHAGNPARGANILTNSWGCPPLEGCDRTVLAPAIAALTAAGIFVAVAAGNSGPHCDTISDAPATDPDAFTVAAVNKLKRLTDFSSRGAKSGPSSIKPDIAAPGADVLSALPGNNYGELSGTSMATPHIAGVVALMWSANPRLIGDIVKTKEILSSTAKPAVLVSQDVTDCGGAKRLVGAGIVDAYAATEAALAAH